MIASINYIILLSSLSGLASALMFAAIPIISWKLRNIGLQFDRNKDKLNIDAFESLSTRLRQEELKILRLEVIFTSLGVIFLFFAFALNSLTGIGFN